MGFLLLTLALAAGPGVAGAREIAIIANPSVPAASLRASDVRDLYLGEQFFIGSRKAKLLDVKEASALKRAFVENVLRLSLAKYKTNWVRRVFQGGGFPPALAAGDEIVERVAKEEGAVGYAWSDDVRGSRVVKILLTLSVP